MTQAQKWLDENYPYDQRTNITKIKTGEKDLEGSLKIERFTNLEEISCGYNQLTSLEIINCPNLKRLTCQNNKLTELKLNSCHELTGLYCSHNKLTNLDLSENRKIKMLDLDDNNFSEQDLSFLSHLVNLERLQLGNIMNIENGLEYLPLSLKEFFSLPDERKDAKSKSIGDELITFEELEIEKQHAKDINNHYQKIIKVSIQKENARQHSENFLTHLQQILAKTNQNLKEIKVIYFTSTPSGQTGIRVALAFLATLQILNPQVKLYHINTLLLQAGTENCISLLTIDSRGSKYQAAVFQNKKCLLETKIVLKEELEKIVKKFPDFSCKKDCQNLDFLTNFQKLKNEFKLLEKIKDIDY
ncbi:6710_t:CDS:2 [Entrophospora sp. SA101]|nr:6710_t:CDS:2 [Entrophospora sp. SA101]